MKFLSWHCRVKIYDLREFQRFWIYLFSIERVWAATPFIKRGKYTVGSTHKSYIVWMRSNGKMFTIRAQIVTNLDYYLLFFTRKKTFYNSHSIKSISVKIMWRMYTENTRLFKRLKLSEIWKTESNVTCKTCISILNEKTKFNNFTRRFSCQASFFFFFVIKNASTSLITKSKPYTNSMLNDYGRHCFRDFPKLFIFFSRYRIIIINRIISPFSHWSTFCTY